MAVIPVAKALYLCEEVDSESGAINLYALFNALNPTRFPYAPTMFVAFAQVTGGLGEMTVHIDLVRARDDRVIYVTGVHRLRFDRRSQTLRVVMTFDGLVFEEPGVYFLQLYCDNTWVADTALEIHEVE